MLFSLYSYFSFCFRQMQTYSSIIQEHTQADSETCVSLPNSEPWHIPSTKDIPTPKYVHNTIFNIFTKPQSWTFDNSECASFLKILYFTESLTLHFRLILTCSRFIQSYLFLLRNTKNPSIWRNSASETLRHILNATHNI